MADAERRERYPATRLAPRDVVKFTAVVALSKIFYDAAIGHGLAWENDPYWTYWITKTFLFATITGLGTAWIGIGIGRGAVISAAHTLVLTVYYWTLSPIGLPSSPNWLDLEHTWITGLPIHFSVIYLGYLTALWIWRRRERTLDEPEESSGGLALAALVVGVVLVVLAGALSGLALQEFPGVTWFLVRILITFPLLLAWWSVVGRDALAAVTGGVLIALVWGAYGQFLGPVGLPDTPLRILDPAPPPAEVRWLDYEELWLISVPIYIVVAVGVLLLYSRRAGSRGPAGRPAMAAAALAAVLFATAFTISPEDRGEDGRVVSEGDTQVETGDWYSDQFEPGTGTIEVITTDMGDRVSPLPPHDVVTIDATVESGDNSYELSVDKPMVSDPLGEHTTWWGVGFHVSHHGHSGIGTPELPDIESELAAFGIGTIEVDGGEPIPVPVHVMTSEGKFPNGARLELDVGDSRQPPVPGLPQGHLRVLWSSYRSDVSRDTPFSRYAIGGPVLLLLLGAAYWLVRREERIR